jgi:hypothetical protein
MADELRRVATAARKMRASRDEFYAAVRAAARQGQTHQAIADAAGITRQRVSVIVKEDRK